MKNHPQYSDRGLDNLVKRHSDAFLLDYPDRKEDRAFNDRLHSAMRLACIEWGQIAAIGIQQIQKYVQT